ncbi:amino acid acetyltransferase [Arthrobacter sp. Leaf141]|uniref:GNAT family N-acetyltransferase n=1 Tax=Arthrobacter sp. Leaf141 TaxID=1736273 RepID=UPI0006FF548E|nr:GNAT family protein [Arthrobacter sp. Leaf141]KQR02869.1 amino acid acetyltransferase [Arthrobacter sp. Leaf141]
MTFMNPVTLTGRRVILEPLAPEHHDGLVDAAADGELWRLWYTSVPTPEGMAAEIRRRLDLQEQGSMLPFTTRLADPVTGGPGQVIGMTTYMNIDAATPRVEIGSTWNAASSQGTGTNPESKLLLLEHAFEALGCPAVEFRTHWLNHQSREAIARLGAKQDGVLRNHSRTSDGILRDTVVFSILEHEWPMVRAGLEYRLARRG